MAIIFISYHYTNLGAKLYKIMEALMPFSRSLKSYLNYLSEYFLVVALTGVRQVWKSTLIKEFPFKRRKQYVVLDYPVLSLLASERFLFVFWNHQALEGFDCFLAELSSGSGRLEFLSCFLSFIYFFCEFVWNRLYL